MHKPIEHLDDSKYLSYVGNGHLGLALSENNEEELFISTSTSQSNRALTVPLSFKPLIHVSNSDYDNYQSARVVNYIKGMIHDVLCLDDESGSNGDISISRQIYAHRTIPEILVQEIRISNPTGKDQFFQLERQGISNWPSASSSERTIEHGDGNKKYVLVFGTLTIPDNSPLEATLIRDKERIIPVVVIVPKLDSTIAVKARMTTTMTYLSAVFYMDPVKSEQEAKDSREFIENRAVKALLRAAGKSTQSLREEHVKIWKSLWTTGFGISHSMAEDAVNGAQINATIYYVLSQVLTPLHSESPTDVSKADLQSYLAYLEGCYGGLPTL